MSHRIIIRAEAEADVTEAAIWYLRQQLGLGEEFLTEIQNAVDKAAINPRSCRRLRDDPKCGASSLGVSHTASSSFYSPRRLLFFACSMPRATIANGSARSRPPEPITFLAACGIGR